MGVVYWAIDTTLRRSVALKVIEQLQSADDSRARLLREARLASSHHANICTVYEVAETGSLAFIAMEQILESIRARRKTPLQ